jgi:hypothetical protein
MSKHRHRRAEERSTAWRVAVEHVVWHSLKASAFLFVFERIERLIGGCGLNWNYGVVYIL